MSQPLEAVLLGAGDRGYYCHGMYAQRYPHKLRYVAVAEPDAVLRDRFGDLHNIPRERRFPSWEELVGMGQLAPALINTTPDRVHMASTVAGLETGYDVLLEKPMATTAEDCVRIVQAAEQTGRILQIHHGYRYAPFFNMINEVIQAGRLGAVMNYAHRENVAFFHMAHSYVRGNWRRRDTSGPIILTKCCHDLDLIVWYIGAKSHKIYSTGSLRHYREENARPDYPERCTDGCPVEAECPYYAPRLYLAEGSPSRIFAQSVALETTNEAILEALRSGPYGRCVYRCDNDVVDNQIVLIEMEDGTEVSLTMHGFSHDGGRSVRIQGTRGTLIAEALQREMIVHDHLTGRRDVLQPGKTTGGHGGGDDGLISAFIHTLQTGETDPRTSARASLESHLMAFAAELSRSSGQIVNMVTYRRMTEARARRGK
jgi:predicted dehydrogenase